MKDFEYTYNGWTITQHAQVFHACGGLAVYCICTKCNQVFPIEVFYQFKKVWKLLDVIPDTDLMYCTKYAIYQNPTKDSEPQPTSPSTETF